MISTNTIFCDNKKGICFWHFIFLPTKKMITSKAQILYCISSFDYGFLYVYLKSEKATGTYIFIYMYLSSSKKGTQVQG